MKIVKAALVVLAIGTLAVSCASGPQTIGRVEINANFDNVPVDTEGRMSTNDIFLEFAGQGSSEWTIQNGALAFTPSRGGKIEFLYSTIADGTVSADIMLTSTEDNGNAGFLVRSSQFSSGGPDSVRGYYIGIGHVNGPDANFNGPEVPSQHAFLQIGRMWNNWTQLDVIPLSTSAVSLPLKRNLRVEMSGNTFEVYVDNRLITTFEDDNFESGSVGIRTYLAEGSIDNLSISNIAAMDALEAAAAAEASAE